MCWVGSYGQGRVGKFGKLKTHRSKQGHTAKYGVQTVMYKRRKLHEGWGGGGGKMCKTNKRTGRTRTTCSTAYFLSYVAISGCGLCSVGDQRQNWRKVLLQSRMRKSNTAFSRPLCILGYQYANNYPYLLHSSFGWIRYRTQTNTK